MTNDFKYILVLQWPSSAIGDFNELVATEEILSNRLQGNVNVDGHDYGSSECNIFILTNDPAVTVSDVITILPAALAAKMKAAYREPSADHYRPIWPRQLKVFSVA